jgi:hypothetical protein
MPTAHLPGNLRLYYPYNDICLDVLIFLIYGASKDTDYPKQEAADVTGESHTRRGVHHPSV